MSTKAVCELLVSWEILENRSVSEVTKLTVNGEVVDNCESVKSKSSANQNGSHEESNTHGAAHGAATEGPANGDSPSESPARTCRQGGSKSGPIHLHPFMHPELIDPACCELRIQCPPRNGLRVTSVEVESNAKHLEFYDAQAEYMHTAKGERGDNPENYTSRWALDRNVFEMVVKFLSLTDAKCLSISSVSITFDRFEWPKDSQLVHSVGHAHPHPHAHAHGHPHAATPPTTMSATPPVAVLSPALFAAGLQRVLANSAANKPPLPSNVSLPISAASANAHSWPERPAVGPCLKQLAEHRFGHCSSSDSSNQHPTQTQTLNSGDANGSEQQQQSGQSPLHGDEMSLFVYQVATALYSDLAQHVDGRFAQLESRLVRHVDDSLALLGRCASTLPSSSGNETTATPTGSRDRD